MTTKTKFWIVIGVIAVFGYVFRGPLISGWLSFTSGAQAAQDAATMNGYTTYNQTLYKAPFWQPVVTFFKANAAFIPSGTSQQNGSAPAAYSTQG